MTQIVLDRDELRPLVGEVVAETLRRLRHINENGEERLAWREDEAAALVGMAQYQLRDRRIEGQVKATKVGRSWYYNRKQLLSLFENG